MVLNKNLKDRLSVLISWSISHGKVNLLSILNKISHYKFFGRYYIAGCHTQGDYTEFHICIGDGQTNLEIQLFPAQVL